MKIGANAKKENKPRGSVSIRVQRRPVVLVAGLNHVRLVYQSKHQEHGTSWSSNDVSCRVAGCPYRTDDEKARHEHVYLCVQRIKSSVDIACLLSSLYTTMNAIHRATSCTRKQCHQVPSIEEHAHPTSMTIDYYCKLTRW